MQNNIMLIITGLVVFLLGLILSGTILDTAATTGANANIDSFSGTKSVNDILPTMWYIGLMITGIGAMGVGGVRAVRGSGKDS